MLYFGWVFAKVIKKGIRLLEILFIMQNQLRTSGKLYVVYKICFLLMFMNSMFPWWMWNNSVNQIVLFVTVFISILLCVTESKLFLLSRQKIGLISILLLSFVWHIYRNEGYLGVTFSFVSWIVLLSFRIEYKLDILRFTTKVFAYFLIASLIFYVLFLFGINFVEPSFMTFNADQYMIWNYYTFTLSVNNLSNFQRFKSVFMEPGHLTMGLVPLIMANRFDLRNKYVVMLIIAELFTFSLAGYITMFVGYLMFNFSIKKIKYIFWGLLVLCILLFILERGGYSEMLDTFLWRRLEFVDGDIAGNNRVTAEFNNVYQGVMNTSDKWMGNSSIDETAYGGVSGYKKYIVMNGLIGLFIIFMLYTYQYFVYRKYDVMVLTIILLLLLFQNAYPFWFCMISMYIIGTVNLHKQNNRLQISK